MRDDLNNISDESPVIRAQKLMQTPLPKRFYERVEVVEVEAGFTVHLDGRPVRTPVRNLLLLPNAHAAKILADEFNAQEKVIDPVKMPATRLVNTAIDGIAQDPQAVLEDILRFAGTDLLCYRADTPQELVARQTTQWDPLIDWAETLGARFVLAEGVMHIEQPREALAAFGVHLTDFREPIALACLHTMTTLTGSAIIALAIAKQQITPEGGWAIAHLDEDWTIEHWGDDAQAASRRVKRNIEMMVAANLLKVL